MNLRVLGVKEAMFKIETGVLWNLTFVVNKVIPRSHKLLGPLGCLAGLGSKSHSVCNCAQVNIQCYFGSCVQDVEKDSACLLHTGQCDSQVGSPASKRRLQPKK